MSEVKSALWVVVGLDLGFHLSRSALVTAVGARNRDWASPLSGSGGLTSIFRLGRSLPASWVASSAQCRAAYVFLSVCGLVGLQCVSGGASSVGDGFCVVTLATVLFVRRCRVRIQGGPVYDLLF